jgi:hypothetical protein
MSTRATRTLRASTILVGAGVMVYGIQGLLTEKQIRQPVHVGEWLLGGVVLHDAVLAPVVFALCWFTTRLTRNKPRTRRLLAAVLVIAGTATLVAAPILLHGKVATR